MSIKKKLFSITTIFGRNFSLINIKQKGIYTSGQIRPCAGMTSVLSLSPSNSSHKINPFLKMNVRYLKTSFFFGVIHAGLGGLAEFYYVSKTSAKLHSHTCLT